MGEGLLPRRPRRGIGGDDHVESLFPAVEHEVPGADPLRSDDSLRVVGHWLAPVGIPGGAGEGQPRRPKIDPHEVDLLQPRFGKFELQQQRAGLNRFRFAPVHLQRKKRTGREQQQGEKKMFHRDVPPGKKFSTGDSIPCRRRNIHFPGGEIRIFFAPQWRKSRFPGPGKEAFRFRNGPPCSKKVCFFL